MFSFSFFFWRVKCPALFSVSVLLMCWCEGVPDARMGLIVNGRGGSVFWGREGQSKASNVSVHRPFVPSLFCSFPPPPLLTSFRAPPRRPAPPSHRPELPQTSLFARWAAQYEECGRCTTCTAGTARRRCHPQPNRLRGTRTTTFATKRMQPIAAEVRKGSTSRRGRTRGAQRRPAPSSK